MRAMAVTPKSRKAESRVFVQIENFSFYHTVLHTPAPQTNCAYLELIKTSRSQRVSARWGPDGTSFRVSTHKSPDNSRPDARKNSRKITDAQLGELYNFSHTKYRWKFRFIVLRDCVRKNATSRAIFRDRRIFWRHLFYTPKIARKILYPTIPKKKINERLGALGERLVGFAPIVNLRQNHKYFSWAKKIENFDSDFCVRTQHAILGVVFLYRILITLRFGVELC